MRFKVYLMRQRGRRLSLREIRSVPPHVGQLQSYTLEVDGQRHRALTLRPADPIAEPPIPDLYEPVLVAFAPLAFRLRGFERLDRRDGSYAVLQEWLCEDP